MRTSHKATCLFIAGVLLAVTATAKVKTVVNKNADFSRYRTYEWLAPRALMKTGLVENDDVVAPAIKAAVRKELAKVGLTEVVKGGDLQIGKGVLCIVWRLLLCLSAGLCGAM